MKKALIACVLLVSTYTFGQENSLLKRSFWKQNPTIQQVEAEIKKGNNPTELNENAFDPTVFAITENVNNEVLKYLLDIKGNDSNKLTHDKRTYLFWAAYKGNIEIMNYTLLKGANINLRDDKGYSPLLFAASAGQSNLEVYNICLKNGIDIKKDVDNNGANALLLAIPHDEKLVLTNYFISKGLSLQSEDKNGYNAFAYATKNGKLNVLKQLVTQGVQPQSNAVIMASQGGRGFSNNLEMYKYIESLKLDLNYTNSNGENALHYVVKKENQLPIITYFVTKKVDFSKLDNDENSPLLNAASSQTDVETFKYVLNLSKNQINTVNTKGISPLTMAVKNNSAAIVNELLKNGASINLVDINGDNLSYYLIQSFNPSKTNDFKEKMNLLIENGLDFKVNTITKNQPIHYAVAKNSTELLELLTPYLKDVNALNNEGMTALHKATLIAKDDKVLKWLIANGANTKVKTDMDETVYELASENKFLQNNNISIEFLK